MSDNTLPADVTVEIDDQAVEKFFESGGEDIIEVKEPAQPAAETQAAQQDQQPTSAETTQAEQKEKMVPYGALHEERERRKEYQKMLQEQQQRYDQALQRILDRTAPQAQQQPIPSFEDDPLNNANYRLQTLEQRLAEKQQIEDQNRAHMEYAQAEQKLVFNYQKHAMAYAQQNPEFPKAYEYLVTQRLKEYEAAGYTPDEANALLLEDEKAMVARAFHENVNPAERIFNLAKVRGFSSQPVQTETQNTAKQNEEKLQRMQKGLAESKSLSNVSGKAENAMSLDVLAAMSDDELDEFITNKNWSKLEKLMQ